MTGNISPIFTRVPDVQGGVTLITASADYTGNNINNSLVFVADVTNGGFVQRLRFKAIGTNIATVGRVYLTANSVSTFVSPLTAPAGTPTGTPGTTGGTMQTGSYFAKIQAIDQYGSCTAASTETASVSVTGPTGNVAWAWTASTGAVGYRIFVGQVTNGEFCYFTSNTNSFNQTAPYVAGQIAQVADFLTVNKFIGEISLPATAAAAASATAEIDYPINMGIPPGVGILVGLGTTVAAGWAVTAIGGKY